MSAGRSGAPDPLRELARERGRAMGELGVGPGDEKWARAEAETIASLSAPDFARRFAWRIVRRIERLRRALR
jgi:hypothetical protein